MSRRITSLRAVAVLVGGQIGPLVQARVNPDIMKIAISVLFISVGGFMLSTVVG